MIKILKFTENYQNFLNLSRKVKKKSPAPFKALKFNFFISFFLIHENSSHSRICLFTHRFHNFLSPSLALFLTTKHKNIFFFLLFIPKIKFFVLLRHLSTNRKSRVKLFNPKNFHDSIFISHTESEIKMCFFFLFFIVVCGFILFLRLFYCAVWVMRIFFDDLCEIFTIKILKGFYGWVFFKLKNKKQ